MQKLALSVVVLCSCGPSGPINPGTYVLSSASQIEEAKNERLNCSVTGSLVTKVEDKGGSRYEFVLFGSGTICNVELTCDERRTGMTIDPDGKARSVVKLVERCNNPPAAFEELSRTYLMVDTAIKEIVRIKLQGIVYALENVYTPK